jgi:hypothetical protein
VVLRALDPGAKVAAMPSTPNFVLPVLDVVSLDGSHWAVYEFVPGATFAEVAAAHFSVERLPSLGLIARIVVDAARAIHQVHTFRDPLGLIAPQRHGGLSDASVLVGFDGQTRVLDLGARRQSRFVAPELTQGESFDAHADVFSLGALLHHATTHFAKGYAATIARAPSLDEFPPPSTVHPEASPAFDAVVMRALMPSASSRFATALALAEEVESVLGPLLFSQAQVHEVLLPLFEGRVRALKELVNPRYHPVPVPSAPRAPASLPTPAHPAFGAFGDGRMGGGGPSESGEVLDSGLAIEDMPTQHNIKVPARGATRAEPDFDPHSTKPGIHKPEPAFDLYSDAEDTTGNALKIAQQTDAEKARAIGQEKISTADLDPEELSPEMKLLQAADLGPLLGDGPEEPTRIKPRTSQVGLAPVLGPVILDPKKKEATLVDDRPAPPMLLPMKPKPRWGVRGGSAVLLAVVAAAATVAVQRYRARAAIEAPALQEPVLEDVDAGEGPEVDSGVGSAVPVALDDADAGPVNDGGSDRGADAGSKPDAGAAPDSGRSPG